MKNIAQIHGYKAYVWLWHTTPGNVKEVTKNSQKKTQFFSKLIMDFLIMETYGALFPTLDCNKFYAQF